MSGIPYIASDGVVWMVTPPEGDPITMDDGDGGQMTVTPKWHGVILKDAYGKAAGSPLVAGTDPGEVRDGIEAFLLLPRAHVEIPAKSDGSFLFLALLAGLWYLDRKGGR